MNSLQYYEQPDQTHRSNMLDEDYLMAEDFSPEFDTDYGLDDFADIAEGLREVMHEDYRDASPEEMQEALLNIMETMSPVEGFNFGNILKGISKAGQSLIKGKDFGQIAKTALPIIGGAVGTIYGGPGVGTALGSELGNVAAQALAGGNKRKSTRVPAVRAAPSVPGRGATASPLGGSAAAANLLQLTQNQGIQKLLAALSMGAQGNNSVIAGQSGSPASAGAILNLISTLAKNATEDAEEILRESNREPSYMQDSEGNFEVDPTDRSGRAQALYQELINAENERLATEMEAEAEAEAELELEAELEAEAEAEAEDEAEDEAEAEAETEEEADLYLSYS